MANSVFPGSWFVYNSTNSTSIARLMKDWNSPIYAFYEPVPTIEYENGRRCHVFKCTARGCKHRVRRYLDKSDATSTGNMRKHVKSCWGEAALETAMD
ncbi:hypothetical protein BU15DRAFT_56970, partial [Melanogaster broomeanus]